MVEFLENVLAFSLKQELVYSYQFLTEEWVFLCFNNKNDFFVLEVSSGLHEKEFKVPLINVFLF